MKVFGCPRLASAVSLDFRCGAQSGQCQERHGTVTALRTVLSPLTMMVDRQYKEVAQVTRWRGPFFGAALSYGGDGPGALDQVSDTSGIGSGLL